ALSGREPSSEASTSSPPLRSAARAWMDAKDGMGTSSMRPDHAAFKCPRQAGAACGSGCSIAAEFAVAALQDQRNDQIFLVIQMAREHRYQALVLAGIGVGGEAPAILVLLHGAQEGIGRLRIALQRIVD